MGCDIYIESISNKAQKEFEPLFERAVKLRNQYPDGHPSHKKYHKEVNLYYDKMHPDNGYFRDSYNSYNLLSVLGLSWGETVEELLDNRGYMHPEQIKQFKTIIECHLVPEPHEITKAPNKEQQTVNNILGVFANMGANTSDGTASRSLSTEDYEYFTEKKKWLLSVLQTAITLNESIYVSY